MGSCFERKVRFIKFQTSIPAPAQEIIDKLNEHGYEAYVVGGCVRDMILGREPGDWDITTSALPAEVKKVFRRTVDTGIQHGTVTVMMGKEGYEVTTYRIDGEYSDGRHPNSVQFTPNLIEDLKRRDFTINAMAYNSRTGFVDQFGGVEDLKRGVIRCVGNPIDRFTEDALRILRAIRFSAQLGFDIEEQTKKAISRIAPNMIHVSKERIQVELTKLLLSSHPQYISLVYELGISPYVSEQFHRSYTGVCGEHPIPPIPVGIPAVKHMRWAAFLRECTPQEAGRILKDLKLDNDTIFRVKVLTERIHMGEDHPSSKIWVRRMMSQMEDSLFDDWLTLRTSLALESGLSCPEELAWLSEIRRLGEEIRKEGDCLRLKDLAVTGHDIMAAGVKPGKEVGDTLTRLLDMVLEEPKRNRREWLLQHVTAEL